MQCNNNNHTHTTLQCNAHCPPRFSLLGHALAMHANTIYNINVKCVCAVQMGTGTLACPAARPSRVAHICPTSRRRQLWILAFFPCVLHSQATAATLSRAKGEKRMEYTCMRHGVEWAISAPARVHAMQMGTATGSHLALALWQSVQTFARAANGRQQSSPGCCPAVSARARSAAPIIGQVVCSQLHTGHGLFASIIDFLFFLAWKPTGALFYDACLCSRRQLRPPLST